MDQFEFTEVIEESLAAIERQLSKIATPDDKSKAALDKAKEALKKGQNVVFERLKIADRSEFGWGVVAEYQADELAQDSDDEKRLVKAEKAAEKKSLKRKRLLNSSSRTRQSSNQMPLRQPPSWITPKPAQRSAVPTNQTPPGPRPIRPCFSCGDLRASCPKAGATKYPVFNISLVDFEEPECIESQDDEIVRRVWELDNVLFPAEKVKGR